MSTAPQDRRAAPRFRLELPASLHLLFPEDTFSVRKYSGHTLDLSALGCRLRVERLEREIYQKLLSPVRYAKVFLLMPDAGELELRGRVVWIDLHDQHAAVPAFCQLGVAYTQTPADFRRRVEEYVAATQPPGA